jgi:flagellar basal body-associated protein FliL
VPIKRCFYNIQKIRGHIDLESKGSLFILLIIISILTLTLAVMAGYLFFVADTQQTNIVVEENSSESKRPADEEISKVQLFDDDTFFNLKSDGRISVLQISAELSYFKKVKGIKNTDEKINFNMNKIKEIIGTYFQGKTFEEITNPEAKEKANKELTKEINEFLLSNEGTNYDIVYEIVFDKWFFQQ